MNKDLISVVIPVYNVEKYLVRCISSILQQTYSNLEIILVNDGSLDNSGKLCDEVARKDSRIKVIHKKNGGLSSARNAGLEMSTGKYVTFVDSDDWLSINIFTRAIEVFDKYDCDVVDYKVILTNKVLNIKENNINESLIRGKENILYDYLYKGQIEECPFSVCRKMYKKNFFKEIRFPEGKINEDIVTNFKVLSKINKLVHISDIGYYYFQNFESITNGKLKKKDFDLLDVSRELCELSKNMSNIKIYNLAKIKLARSYFSLLAKGAVYGISDDIKEPNKRIAYLTKNLRKNYILLMSSPISLKRKVVITMLAVNFNLMATLIKIYYLLTKEKK